MPELNKNVLGPTTSSTGGANLPRDAQFFVVGTIGCEIRT